MFLYMQKLYISLILNFIITILFSSLSIAYPQKSITTERNLFTQAELALKKRKLTLYKRLTEQLKNYPLYQYLKYNEMQQNIAKVSFIELEEFINAYPDSPLIDKLRTSWLYANAKNKNWKNFLLGYQYSEDTELQCNYIWSHYTVKRDPSILKYAEPLWLNGESQPKACNIVFEAWEKHHPISRPILWQRIKLAINLDNHKLARYLAKKLKKTEIGLVELWIRTNNNPYLINKQHYFTSKHPAIVEILVHGITKIANKDAKAAINAWKQIAKRYTFSEKHWATVVKNIGMSLAKEKHPETEKWLSKISTEHMDQPILEARLLFAIHSKNWNNIIKIYQQLPEQNSKNEQWLYWKARALDILGEKQTSKEIFQQLAICRSYYGFLASIRTAIPYTFTNKTLTLTEQDLIALAKRPALIRAYELHQLGKPHLGNVEWNYALKNMSDTEKEIAAAIAAEWKIPNWSISALVNANNKKNLTLRFPKTYSKYVLKEASENNIDPALIFAITRQESAFITTARSSAGALGLMQLIPSTAKMTAKLLNERLRSNRELLKADKNIRLGSKYLRLMLDKYQQNSVLAAAAYNAGPARIQQWLPDYNMPADIWIESIPFKETRNYVKNVLAYTVIYQKLLGKRPLLTKHMPYIKGAP